MIIWAVGIIVAYLVLKYLVGLGINYYRATHLPPPSPPNQLFGKLPYPKFPDEQSSSSGLNFLLENIEGRPPETTSSAKVYFLPKKLPSLLAPQKAREFAGRLGFGGEAEVVSSTFYRFVDPKYNLRTLEMDIVNLNYKLDYDYGRDQSVFTIGNMPSRDRVIEEVRSYLSENGVDSTFFVNPPKLIYLKFDPGSGQFNPVKKEIDADAARIDIYRSDVDGWKLLPPNYGSSYNFVLYANNGEIGKRYLKIAYTFWPFDMNNFGTYPLRTSDDAWKNLIDGQGVVATFGNNSPEKQIVIRKIYLAYYDSGEQDNYLQPIFVFEGDGDFAAYVPAILLDSLE